MGGSIGFFVSGQYATFSTFTIAPLSGPDEVTDFCYGGTCDSRTGLCSTQPTALPTSRSGEVAIPDVCPGPVGGNSETMDTTDETNFRFVDMASLNEPCEWTVGPEGVSQTTRAWGNYCGPDGCPSGNWSEHVTIMGCVALVGGGKDYTDFMLEVTATHEGEDGWGLVFGWDSKQVVPQNYVAFVNNDRWPDPSADSVRGPFMKLKKTNDKPCIPIMNSSYVCYDTISYAEAGGHMFADDDWGLDLGFNTDNRGRFSVDNERSASLIFPANMLKFILTTTPRRNGPTAR